MLSNALFILLVWGPIAIWERKNNSYFPYLAAIYVLAIGFGIWLIFNPNESKIGFPFAAGAYVLYVVTGTIFWIREQGNPEYVHIDWREVLQVKEK